MGQLEATQETVSVDALEVNDVNDSFEARIASDKTSKIGASPHSSPTKPDAQESLAVSLQGGGMCGGSLNPMVSKRLWYRGTV